MGNDFDEDLLQRLVAFQRAHGLTEDGKAGNQTWEKLAEAYKSQALEQQQAEPDNRSDAEIVKELEQRTHKSIDELTLGLGLGLIQITPRELEARLYANNTLRRRLPDNSKHTVLDEVIERDDYMDNRFVTRGVVGRPEDVARRKAAGEAELAAQLQQNLATLAQGMSGVRIPAKSPPPAGKPASPGANKGGPVGLDKVDQQRLGGGGPANDHTVPTSPSNVVPIRPPAEQEPATPHGEVYLDTGTGTGQVRSASGPRRPGGTSKPKAPAGNTKTNAPSGGTGGTTASGTSPDKPTPKVKLLSMGNRRANRSEFLLEDASVSDVEASKKGYQVYEYYSADGTRLYFGKSGGKDGKDPNNWVDRGWAHIYEKPEIIEASTVKVTAELTHAEAAVLEADLISSRQPELNKIEGVPPVDQDYAANLQSANRRPMYVFKVKMVPPQ